MELQSLHFFVWKCFRGLSKLSWKSSSQRACQCIAILQDSSFESYSFVPIVVLMIESTPLTRKYGYISDVNQVCRVNNFIHKLCFLGVQNGFYWLLWSEYSETRGTPQGTNSMIRTKFKKIVKRKNKSKYTYMGDVVYQDESQEIRSMIDTHMTKSTSGVAISFSMIILLISCLHHDPIRIKVFLT